MKTPDYVAEVARTYRKYIDLFSADENTNISENDKKDLLQVFNRGNFSLGHLNNDPNKNLIYPFKPNNMGIFLGYISNYNNNNGHIQINLNEKIAIGDTISIDGETGTYTVSEIINNNKTLKAFEPDGSSRITLGRMKGNIKVGSKVYKISSKNLKLSLEPSYKENANLQKIPLNCFLSIKKHCPIKIRFETSDQPPFYNNISIEYISDIIPEESITFSTSKERIMEQISKLGNTPYYINNFEIDLDDNLHISHISDLNTIRRNAIEQLENTILNLHKNNNLLVKNFTNTQNKIIPIKDRKISVLLEYINLTFDYSALSGFDNIYIPLKFFKNKKYFSILKNLSNKFKMYIYMPTILKSNYKNLLLNDLDEIINIFNIKGFIISNISEFTFLDKYIEDMHYDFVANFTMNIFNSYTINKLKAMGISTITPSVELDSTTLNTLINNSILPVELVAYSRNILMNTSYCLLGKSNRCYPDCTAKCTSSNNYYLKDRLGYTFRIIPDNLQTVTSIYNSKVTSIGTKEFNVHSIRINVLDESIKDINTIISAVKSGNKLEGKNFTNGNLNRNI